MLLIFFFFFLPLQQIWQGRWWLLNPNEFRATDLWYHVGGIANARVFSQLRKSEHERARGWRRGRAKRKQVWCCFFFLLLLLFLPGSPFARRVSDPSIVVRYDAKVSRLTSPAHTVKKNVPQFFFLSFFFLIKGLFFLPFCLLRSTTPSLPPNIFYNVRREL